MPHRLSVFSTKLHAAAVLHRNGFHHETATLVLAIISEIEYTMLKICV